MKAATQSAVRTGGVTDFRRALEFDDYLEDRKVKAPGLINLGALFSWLRGNDRNRHEQDSPEQHGLSI